MVIRNSWDSTYPVGEANGGTNTETYVKGDLLYASGSNTLSKLNVGSDNDVYYVNTDVPAENIGVPGSSILLSSQTAATSASIIFSSVVDATKYDYYKFVLAGIKSTSNGSTIDFIFQWSTDNGLSYITSAYNWVRTYTASSFNGQVNNTSDSSIKFQDYNGTGTGEGISLNINFFPSTDATVTYNMTNYDVSSFDSDTTMVNLEGAGLNTTTSAINAFKFFYDAGNIDKGKFHMYGILK